MRVTSLAIPVLIGAVAVAVIVAAPARADQPAPAPVQVMVLGVYHLGNPGRDIHNTKADDVTLPRRQAELAELATRLARFKPTRIAVETKVDAADLKYPAYRAYKPADLTRVRNEITQIGFRVAHQLGHTDVYGIDEHSDTIDYFPYLKVKAYVERAGGAMAATLAAWNKQLEAEVKVFNEAQKTQSISALLARLNQPARVKTDGEMHYIMLGFGDATSQPGADLNGAWYLRNAKIFAKLMQIAKPGDRILVVFGAGHNFWLRHFVESTPGFQLVEPNDYLTAAK